MKTNSIIEQLEPRIAPAGVTVNDLAKMATWTDHDGDMVTLKWTTKAPAAFHTTDEGVGVRVDRIDLTAANNSNESFTLTVKAGPLGNGHVDLGHVDATGVPLKSWSSPAASLLDIDCGNGTIGIGTLKVGSLGTLGGAGFGAMSSNAYSQIDGATSTVTILGDIGAAALGLTKIGKMKSLTIGGSLRGTDESGPLTSGALIVSGGSLGTLTIGGSVMGGDKSGDGQIFVTTPVTSFVLKGSILGGTEETTGYVSVNAKNVLVGGSIVGGSHTLSGIGYFGAVKSLTVGGSIIGGSESGTGGLAVDSADSILIKGSIVGGFGTAATSTGGSGGLSVYGNSKSITIGGDLVAGTYKTGTRLGYNGDVIVYGNVASLSVKGNITGNADTDAVIIAKGAAPATPGSYNAIGALKVGGSVSYGYLAAGQGRDDTSAITAIGVAENPDAGIGSVTVGGDWFHSSLTAGVNDANTTGFSSNDTHSAGDPARLAKIGAVAIKGYIMDNPGISGFSGFGADKIASIVAHGVKLYQSGDAARSLDAAGFVDVMEFV